MKTLIKTLTLVFFFSSISFKSTLSYANDFIDHTTYLTDTTSGLDWLDVTLSAGLSYTEVSNQLETGNVFESWRYATAAELIQLITNFTHSIPSTNSTIPGTNIAIYYLDDDLLDPLVIALGSTLDVEFTSSHGTTYDDYYNFEEGEGIDYTLGYIYTPDHFNKLNIAEILDDDTIPFNFDNHPLEGADYFTIGENEMPRSPPSLNIGSFLVRESNLQVVPVPSSIWFMFSSLIALFSISRKIKV